MAQPLTRTWVRFGAYMTAAALLVMLVLGVGLLWQQHDQRDGFYANMPADVHAELDQLQATGQEKSARAADIYEKYWPDDGPGLAAALLLGLVVSVLLGCVAAVLADRIFIRPLASVAEAALRIAKGDLTVRARALGENGELAELVRNFNLMAASRERLENERKDTIAAISHELRTPLTILQGRLHGLCDGVIASSDAEHRKLLDQAEHLVRLVEDLNTLTLVQAERLSLHCSSMDLGSFITQLVPLYAERAASHGVKMELHTETALVLADRDRLRQVVTNLIENTLHYAADGGVLEIRVMIEGQLAILELSDRGPGLPEGVTERVFDPFFRVDNSRSRATGGSGLGLAVVQMLIAQHKGSIEAENRAGGGATFRISLPLLRPQ